MKKNLFEYTDELSASCYQEDLSKKVIKSDICTNFTNATGVDAAYIYNSSKFLASAVSINVENMKIIELSMGIYKSNIEYIPGLFSFLEGPAIVDSVNKLNNKAQLIICDGHGIAHPRRLGLASHVGLALDTPTIGCAKTRLIGEYVEPGIERGCYSDLIDNGEIIGRVLRTQTNVKPVFVSIGHKISLDTACEWILKLSPKYRLPETTRAADHAVRTELKNHHSKYL